MLGLFKHPHRFLATRPYTTSIRSSASSRAITSSAFHSRLNPSIASLKNNSAYLRHYASAALAMSPKPNGAANGHPLESYGNFDLVRRLKLDFADIVVSKWQSRETGLSVVHLDYDGTPL